MFEPPVGRLPAPLLPVGRVIVPLLFDGVLFLLLFMLPRLLRADDVSRLLSLTLLRTLLFCFDVETPELPERLTVELERLVVELLERLTVELFERLPDEPERLTLELLLDEPPRYPFLLFCALVSLNANVIATAAIVAIVIL